MRIAMVTEYAYPVLGGISEHVHHLSGELAGLGHEVTVVTGRPPGSLRSDAALADRHALLDRGYDTVRVGASYRVPANGSLARVSAGPGLSREVRDAIVGADLVHIQGLVSPTLPLLALREAREAALVGTFHTYLEPGHWGCRAFRRPLRRLLARLDRRIVVSNACMPGLTPHFPGRYDVVPNGVDCDRYRPLSPGETPPDGPPRILFVGRFEPRNDLPTLLDAAAILGARGRAFALDVVGDGPPRRRLIDRARALGIADLVSWHGALNAGRSQLYREAAVFAAPCTIASFGVVLLEAMASGIAIVCADNPGFRQVIRDGAPGRFVRPRDPEHLARALDAVLGDAALRARWAVEGRALAQSLYAWPVVARRVEALYEGVVGSEAGRPGEGVATTAG